MRHVHCGVGRGSSVQRLQERVRRRRPAGRPMLGSVCFVSWRAWGEHERVSGRRSRPSVRFTGKLEKHCNLLSTSPSSFMESWWLDWCLTFEWGSESNKVDGETFSQRKPFLSAALRVCLTFAVVVVVVLFPLHHFLLGELPLPRAALKS